MARFTPDAPLVRVTTTWTASYTPALAVRRGEPLTFKGTDPDNPGWRWAENAEALGGWLPIDLIKGDHLTEDFNSTELTARVGTSAAVIRRLNGWSLCETEDGASGWLPDTSLAATHDT